MTTDPEIPRVQLAVSLEEMRDIAKLLRWMVLHCVALRGRAAVVEPENEETREKSARLLEAYSSAYMREVLVQLGAPDLMRRLFADPPDPSFSVNPEPIATLARAVLEELDAEERAADARREGAIQ